PKKPTQAVPKGHVRHSHSADNMLHIYSWMDNGPVYLLDSVIGAADSEIERQVGARRETYNVPEAYSVYNANMGGVDRFDQVRTGYFGIDMQGRTCKWTIRAYEALVNMCVTNAYAAWRTLSDP